MNPKPKPEIRVEYVEPVSEETAAAFLDALANIVIDHYYADRNDQSDEPIVGE